MKKVLFSIIITTMFISSMLLANSKIYKKHLKMTGKDNAKVNCAYCHKSPGAKLPKKKGQDAKLHDTHPYCAMSGCHPLKKKK